MDTRSLHVMAGVMTAETWRRSSQMLTPGQSAERFMIIVRGRVKIVCSNAHDGRELTLWLLGPGDAFDVVSLLDGEPHSVSAWALDEVETVSAPMSVFRHWLERFPQLRKSCCRYTAAQVRSLTALSAELALHDTMTRLVQLLVRHYAAGSAASPHQVNLIRDLPHEELAHLVGSVRVVINRLLARLRRQGVVATGHNGLSVVNLQRLLWLADDLHPAQVRRVDAAGRD
ncbi:MAG TPA: Crp/Fnr family transcriptional regulator [Steroidobacteraceae bacterium]|nr:Crp/Fnr family transcriptional regulator [Steroidobacteraceae bacterium]